MRILVISNFYPPAAFGGYERECARVVEHLRRGHQVVVLTSRHSSGETPGDPSVLRMLPYGRGRKLDSLAAPWRSLRAARTTRATLRQFSPDLIFVWNGTQIPQVTVRIAERSQVPLAYRVCEHWFGRLYRADTFLRHLYPGDRGLRRAWAAWVRLVNLCPSLRIEVSTPAPATVSWASDALRALAGPPPTVTPLLERTQLPGIEIPQRLVREPSPRPSIAFVGRLVEEKAPDLAVRALALLRERFGWDASLEIAGGGSPAYVETLRRLASELGVEAHVELAGNLAPPELAALMARAHAVVVPSRWQEPSGTVVTEAAAAGTPVVASLSGGMPEQLREEEEALFFAIDDVEGCARALARVLDDPAASRARAERARAKAAELSLDRYLAAQDRFVEETMEAFEGPGPLVPAAVPERPEPAR